MIDVYEATFIALLRAVNVGGRRVVAMSDLRALVAGLGFDAPQSLLQSGNLVFRGRESSAASLERALEDAARIRLGLRTGFHVRTGKEWSRVLARNPFPRAAECDPGHLHVLFMKEAPAASCIEALRAAITGRETVAGDGRHVYAVYPDGVGRSKLTTALIEKALGMPVTMRNWNTVSKLGALADAISSVARGDDR